MNKPEKITFFMQDFSGGGAEKMFINILNKLYSLGYNVSLVVVRSNGPYKTKLDRRIPLYDLNSSKTIFAIFKFIKHLNQYKPDVVVSTLVHINILSVLCSKISSSKHKTIIRESNALSKQKAIRFFLIKIAVYLAPYIYPFADKSIAVSKGVKSDLVSYGRMNPNKVHVIYNPAITDGFINQIQNNEDSAPHRWLNSDNKKVIITAGRFEKQKDFLTLIKAFKLIRVEIDAYLILLGDGSERDLLQKETIDNNISDFVDFPGFVDTLPQYMKNADLFILSSKWEGFGNVLPEALACDLQVVSTDCPYGPSEILEDGKYGALVPVGDYDAMAGESVSILKGEKKFNGLKKRAMDFHVDKIANEYLKVMLDYND